SGRATRSAAPAAAILPGDEPPSVPVWDLWARKAVEGCKLRVGSPQGQLERFVQRPPASASVVAALEIPWYSARFRGSPAWRTQCLVFLPPRARSDAHREPRLRRVAPQSTCTSSAAVRQKAPPR